MDRSYTDEEAAELYDVLNVWGECDEFYLRLVMRSRSVLDVGCGTGILLRRARRQGHSGRLCGLDPDVHRLSVAGIRTDIEWHLGVAASIAWEAEFDLAVMTGHAFQCLLEDDEIVRSFGAIRRSLKEEALFAFETRNPLSRAWEAWPDRRIDVVDQAGRSVTVSYRVEDVRDDRVCYVETTRSRMGEVLREDCSWLRFLGPEHLGKLLLEGGFEVERQFGTWKTEPITDSSPEIITLARASP